MTSETHNSNQTLPVIAIAGRPNVGKSALFNRLVGRQIALVHHSSGVTRDRLAHVAQWQKRKFKLIDTGGLEPPTTSDDHETGVQHRTIADSIRRQVEAALRETSIIIMLADLQAGLLPLDVEVADFLRRTGIPVLLAANKADTPAQDQLSADFNSLGFPVYPVSALHNRGLDELMSTAIAALPFYMPPDIESTPLKITVLGRPNTGKSSFINNLLADERLIVSDIPGTTRDCIDVAITLEHGENRRDYLLTDTAGIRKVNRLRAAVDYMSLKKTENQIKRADVTILMLDAAQGPTAQDKRIARMIIEHGKGIVPVLNKWDILPRAQKPEEGIKFLNTELPFLEFAPVICTSARTGFNVKKALATAALVAENTRRQLPTGPLNRTIMRAIEQVQPPMIKGRRLKIYYATQTGIQPLTITLFVNTPARLTAAYETFLIKRLRREFGLVGAPVILKLKSSHGEKAPDAKSKNQKTGSLDENGDSPSPKRYMADRRERTKNREHPRRPA